MKLEFKVRWLKASFIHSKSEKILSVEQWFSNSVMPPLKDRRIGRLMITAGDCRKI